MNTNVIMPVRFGQIPVKTMEIKSANPGISGTKFLKEQPGTQVNLIRYGRILKTQNYFECNGEYHVLKNLTKVD